MQSRMPEMPETRITRRSHVTDPAAALDEALKENDVLAAAIADLQACTLTSEELAYVRNKKDADDRAAWAWRMIRLYVPWITAVCGALGSGAYWTVTHFTWRQTP